VEADLSAPILDTKEVSVKFAVSGLYGDIFGLINQLSDEAYHTFRCVEIGRTFRLRMTQMSSLDTAKLLGFFTIKFADDFPPELESEDFDAEPLSKVVPDDSYTIDGRAFTDFGVRVFEGSLSEVLKQPQVKSNLLRNIATLPGAIYDPEIVTYKSKDVKLTCLARASDLETLWHNLDCLLYALTRPEERKLGVAEVESEFAFYYKSCSVSEFEPTCEPWLKFSLTIVFTQTCRIGDDDCVLSAENGAVFFTEDAEYAIDMRPMNS
jgi:hypothetical protein